MAKAREIGSVMLIHHMLVIEEISDIVPIKYDGIEECYVVCAPADADGMAILDKFCNAVLITTNCINKEMLIDIV
jgi:hypothetical protein